MQSNTTILAPPSNGKRLPLSETPFITPEELLLHPNLEVYLYKISNVEILRSLPNLREAILDLPQGSPDPLFLLPNISPEVDFRYTVKIGVDTFYIISNTKVLIHRSTEASILGYLREKGVAIESYSGELDEEITRDLLEFSSLCKLRIGRKKLSFLSDELLTRLTLLRVNSWRWDEYCDAFIERIRGKVYPQMRSLRLPVPQDLALTLRLSFPNIKSIYARVYSSTVEELEPALEDFQRVHLMGETENPARVSSSLTQVYPNVVTLRLSIRVKDIPRSLEVFPNITDVYVWEGEEEIPWSLLQNKRVYLCRKGRFPRRYCGSTTTPRGAISVFHKLTEEATSY